MSAQTTDKVLMVSPTNFGFNEEAFETNSFQNKPEENENTSIQEAALAEFNAFVAALESKGVTVLEFRDVEGSTTPDSIFPNNWFSTHYSGVLYTYPMAVSNRRAERRPDIVVSLINDYNYSTDSLTNYENENPPAFLEGTGSLIFDHDNKVVYAAISPRTYKNVVLDLAERLGYTPVTFTSYGKTGELIYHTNVMMCVGQDFIAIGLDTIAAEDRAAVEAAITASGKTIVALSNDQVYNHFTGNMLQVENDKEERVLVLSDTAYKSLTPEQVRAFERYNEHFVVPKIPTIERIGGGSARCMLAEIFLPNFDNLNS